MRRDLIKFLAVAVFITALVFAIWRTSGQSSWMDIWMLLFFFVGIPGLLLSVKDLLRHAFKNRSKSFNYWLMIHICAIFFTCICLLPALIGCLIKISECSKSKPHEWLFVFIPPALVYLAPISVALHHWAFDFIKSIASIFIKFFARAFMKSSIGLPDGVREKVSELTEQGRRALLDERYAEALTDFKSALELLPEPKTTWKYYTQLKISMANIYFHLKEFSSCTTCLHDALNGPDGMKNPFIHLRLGQALFEQFQMKQAESELLQAYKLAGTKIFSGENQKYFNLIKLKI